MIKSSPSLRRLLSASRSTIPQLQHVFRLEFSTCARLESSEFRVGDRVLFTWFQSKEVKRKLSKPLSPKGDTIINNFPVKDTELINQSGDVSFAKYSKDGTRHIRIRARHPTFDEFTALAPRRVAPIYASYCSTIVSLLDIHVPRPSASNHPLTGKSGSGNGAPSFQILEAGTGHGSLTIHLSQAIAAANPAPLTSEGEELQPYSDRVRLDCPLLNSDGSPADEAQERDTRKKWADWRAERRAVVHTIDIDKQNSQHAEKTIASFRGGIYWPHIDFYDGNVRDWVRRHSPSSSSSPSPSSPSPSSSSSSIMSKISSLLPDTASTMSSPSPNTDAVDTGGGEQSSRDSEDKSAKADAFLDVVILDMPAAHRQIEHAVRLMKPDAQLLVFMPQITQIVACVSEVKERKLPLFLEKVVELGDGVSNGRSWDIRIPTLKSQERKSRLELDTKEQRTDDAKEEKDDDDDDRPDTFPAVVCRPLVYEHTRGGGFVGLWRKKMETLEESR